MFPTLLSTAIPGGVPPGRTIGKQQTQGSIPLISTSNWPLFLTKDFIFRLTTFLTDD